MSPNVLRKPRAGALLLAALIACSSAGCASRAAPAQMPETSQSEGWSGARVAAVAVPPAPSLPAAERELTFLFSGPAGRRTAHAVKVLRETLQRAGYRLVLDAKAPHQAGIEIFFAQTGDSDAVEMHLRREDRQIESLVQALPANEPAVQAAFDELVTRLTLSPRLALLTRPNDTESSRSEER